MSTYIKINIKHIFFLLCLLLIYLINSTQTRTVDSMTVDVVPINVETRSLSRPYLQLGILTCKTDIILPLMGRQIMLNKWQYYAISNTATINTKLPMTFQGKKCSSEYGCDQLMNDDVVKVDGYHELFRVTLYENEKLQYIPY